MVPLFPTVDESYARTSQWEVSRLCGLRQCVVQSNGARPTGLCHVPITISPSWARSIPHPLIQCGASHRLDWIPNRDPVFLVRSSRNSRWPLPNTILFKPGRIARESHRCCLLLRGSLFSSFPLGFYAGWASKRRKLDLDSEGRKKNLLFGLHIDLGRDDGSSFLLTAQPHSTLLAHTARIGRLWVFTGSQRSVISRFQFYLRRAGRISIWGYLTTIFFNPGRVHTLYTGSRPVQGDSPGSRPRGARPCQRTYSKQHLRSFFKSLIA